MAHYKGAATEANRAMQILKRRERAKEDLEVKKRKIEEDLKLIDNKFATHNDPTDTQFKSTVVGLVTLDEMKEKREAALRERERQLALGDQASSSDMNPVKTDSTEFLKNKKRVALSFGYSDEEDEDSDNEEDKVDAVNSSKSNTFEKDIEESPKPAKIEFDIDTSFLPDRERDEVEKKLREKLALEWRERQAKLKEENIEITFSFWDGSGHRRMVQMKKGHSVYQFLQKCLELLRKEFVELRTVSADQLMYVKEDLIIPHHYTFYDFIVTKARGKSGPLFSFDVHDDVRLIGDATIEKDESHAGKVLLRSWYERNKHIFPASRWEPYEPSKKYDKYTISDKKTSAS